MSISPARTAALRALTRIDSGEISSTVLPDVERDLQPLDRSLCHAIVLGTLRRQLYFDAWIERLAAGKKLDLAVRHILRAGLFQISFLDRVPAYSVVNESVELVRRAKKSSASGLVNALLRRAANEGFVPDAVDPLERLSIETSHPLWLVERWMNEFGSDDAEALLRFNNAPGRVAFRVLVENETVDALVARSSASRFVGGCYIAPPNADLISLATRGEIYIQDEASQLAASLVRISPGGRILDVCAAPGGKTGMIARQSAPGTFVAAGDLSGDRIQTLRENLSRQSESKRVAIVRYDAESRLPFAEGSFDLVFVDAPCTGTGTIRANPEIRYRLDAERLVRAHLKQRVILRNASKLVRPGGELLYTTCSLELDENQSVCNAFLAETGDFRTMRPDVDDRFITQDDYARTWPPRDEMDGFFIGRFRREG